MYDIFVFSFSSVLISFLYNASGQILDTLIIKNSLFYLFLVFISRMGFKVYSQIWRYGSIQNYIRFIVADAVAFIAYTLFYFIPLKHTPLVNILALSCVNLIGSLGMRMAYRYAFKCSNNETPRGKTLRFLVKIFAGMDMNDDTNVRKIAVAIIGAGKVGVNLAEELLNNKGSSYYPCCFVDINKEIIGREIHGLPVLDEAKVSFDKLKEYGVQEIIFAIPSIDAKRKQQLYNFYKKSGCKLKVYDYPIVETASGKRMLREFDVEELLFRKPIRVVDQKTTEYYKDKVILITGGGGSIGSELSRQLAKMQPKQIVLLDIYENGA